MRVMNFSQFTNRSANENAEPLNENEQEGGFKAWMLANFERDELQDMISHGVDGGFSGLTYYSDTIKLYETHHEEIWTRLVSDAEQMGSTNVFEFIASFKMVDQMTNDETFKNGLVWYMAEETAREFVEGGDAGIETPGDDDASGHEPDPYDRRSN